jgi:hypothetical protein
MICKNDRGKQCDLVESASFVTITSDLTVSDHMAHKDMELRQ